MLARAQGWPSRSADTLIRAGVARPPVVRWVLVAAALLCGMMISGAVFAVAWRGEARRRDSAEARLTGQQARVAELARRARTLNVALIRERRRQAATTRAVGVLQKALRSSDLRRREFEHSAASLAGAASSLRAEIETIVSYVRRASPLDRGYLQTQLAYVERQAASPRAPAAPARGDNQRP